MTVSNLDRDYVEKIQGYLRDDLASEDDWLPYGMYEIMLATEAYSGKVSEDVLEFVVSRSRWLVHYFMHCRHMSRPIDEVLANRLIDSLG